MIRFFSRWSALAFLFCFSGISNAATAMGDCTSTDCPAAFASSDCNGICTIAPSTNRVGVYEISCSPGKGTKVISDPVVYAVTDYDSGGEFDYSVWGYDGDGDKFGCYEENDQIGDISIFGTTREDDFYLRYAGRNMDVPASGLGIFWAFVYGKEGTDNIYGSGKADSPCAYPYGTGYYTELLYGGSGAGLIDGNAGADLILGENGADELYGGDGDDCIYGGNGTDEIWGEADEDFIHGGNGADELYGGNDSDEILGRDGADHIEGGEGNDLIRGGDGDDYITGGVGNDDLYGEGDSDLICDSSSLNVGGDYFAGGTGYDYMYVSLASTNPTGVDTSPSNCCGYSLHPDVPYLSKSSNCSYLLTSCARTSCSLEGTPPPEQ